MTPRDVSQQPEDEVSIQGDEGDSSRSVSEVDFKHHQLELPARHLQPARFSSKDTAAENVMHCLVEASKKSLLVRFVLLWDKTNRPDLSLPSLRAQRKPPTRPACIGGKLVP